MKTKIMPFDVETAKKIQAGEIEGKIKTRDGKDVDEILFFKTPLDYNVYAVINGTLHSFTQRGFERISNKSGTYSGDLVLEVPYNEPQFKPFDKVLVRDSDDEVWRISLYESCGNNGFYVLHGAYYKQCVSYEGNELLVGTTDKPKEK